MGANIKVGITSSDFKKQMADINRNLKLMASNCQLAATEASKFGSKSDQLKAKQSELTQKIAAMNTQVKLQQDRIKAINSNIDTHKSKMSTLKTEIESATKAYKAECEQSGKNSAASKALKDKLEDLKEEYAKEEKAMQSSNKELDNVTIKMNNTKTAIIGNKKALEDTDKALKNVKFDEVSRKLDTIKTKSDKVAKVTRDGALVGTAVIAGSIKAYEDEKKGIDNVITATGAQGDALEGLKDVYKDVTNNSLADMNQIGSTIGEINTRFGYTDDALKESTDQFLKFSKITGVDATESVKLVTRAMGDAGIKSEDYSNVLDELASAGQASGISVDRLADNLTKFGAPMRALGFDTKESIALFSQWEKAGVNTEIAFSGMKKAISNWGKAGKDGREEFKKTLEEIKKCPDIASATTKSIEVFGAKAGPDLADAIQGGRFSIEEMTKVIENSKGTVDNTFNSLKDGTEEGKLALRNLKNSFGEVGESIVKSFAPTFKSIGDTVKDITQKFNKLDDNTKQNIGKVIVYGTAILGSISLVSKAIGGVTKTIGGVMKAVKLFRELGIAGKIIGGVSTVFNFIKGLNIVGFVSSACSAIGGILSGLFGLIMAHPVIAVTVAIIGAVVLLWNKCEWFRDGVKQVWEDIKWAFGSFGEWMKGVFNNDWSSNFGAFGDIMNGFFHTVGDIWGGIKGVFGGVIDFVAGVFTGDWSRAWQGVKEIFGGIFGGLGAIIKAPLNAVIALINGAISGINSISIDIPSWVPGFGGRHFGAHLGKINYLYNGGIVTKPTFINGNTVAGDAYKGMGNQEEAVIPLDKMYNNIRKIMKEENSQQIFVVKNYMDSEEISEITYKKVNGNLVRSSRRAR